MRVSETIYFWFLKLMIEFFSSFLETSVLLVVITSCQSPEQHRFVLFPRSMMEPSLQLRIVAIFVIIFVSGLGLASPQILKFFVKDEKTDEKTEPGNPHHSNGHHHHGTLLETPVFRITKTFTGGLLLAVALCHLLGDSVSFLSDDGFISATEGYPIPEAGAVTGCLFVLGLELLGKLLSTSYDQQRVARQPLQEANIEAAIHEHNEESSCPHQHLSTNVTTVARLLIFELSIAMHSVVIGFSMGSMTNAASIGALLIAFVFHQLFEGVCLGILLMEVEQLSIFVRTLLQMIFILSLAIGIVLGIVTVQSVTSNLVSGVANSFAAGCLIYGSLVNIIGEEFSKVVANEPAYLKPMMYGGVVTGCGFMGLIAVWA